MDVPALPWTEHAMPWASPATRLRVQQGWERIPRRRDLVALRSWRAGARMHRELFRDGHTMLYPLRARTLHRLARHADRDEIPGALVDCGSWNGGSTALLSAGSPRREVWAFDSFAGLPAPTMDDVPDEETLEQYEAVTGWLQASPDRVRAAVARFGRPEHLHVVGGWLAETLPEAAPGIGPIAVLHIDVDWYESVRLALEHLYPLVSPGGWVVIDDYGAVPGAGLATREFRRAVGDDAPLVRVDQTGRYWRKRP
jgi:O-methyltransferase